MNLLAANELVLRIIGEATDQMILGFLPMSLEEEEAVLRLVRSHLESPGASINGLLRIAPAATGYALAVAPSRSLRTGGEFWPALVRDLGLHVDVNRRAAFAANFRSLCGRLGLLAGTIEDAAWVHAAPFIYQSGILHFWTDSLATGLRSVLRRVPAPDLEDAGALRRFAGQLTKKIYNQPILCQVLRSDIGPLLVRRLVKAYVKQDWSVLPPHLKDRIRESFAEVGRGLVLRSPFLGFDEVFRTMEIVLPAQSGRLASPDTHWRVQNRRYSARGETRIPLSEWDEANTQITLCDLTQGFEDQPFEIDTRFSETVPYRVFRKDTGRERKLESFEDAALPFGTYFVVMLPDVRTNDEDYVFETTGIRGIEVELRPGDDPLCLSQGERNWRIRAALQPGIYVDRERAQTALLEDGDLLHYGGDLGLIAYLPAEGTDDSSFRLAVSCEEQQLDVQGEVAAAGSKSGAYLFQDNLQQPIAGALGRLPPGIHRLKLSLSTSSGRVDHRLWYWKGLQQISEAFGFRCTGRPTNLNIGRSRGLIGTDRGIVFKPGYHAPVVRLALDSPVHVLELPRAGVQALVMEPGSGGEEEATPGVPLVVAPNDGRVLRFRSGGFERWQIVGNDRLFAVLDRNRTSVVKSLTGLASECGGSGRIYALGDNDQRILLVSFTRPLTASAPKYELDHARGADVWRFRLPVSELHDLGVSITELTDEPTPDPGEIVVIAKRMSDNYVTVEHQIADGAIVIATKHTGAAQVQGDQPDDGAGALHEDAVRPPPLEEIRVEIASIIKSLGDRIWAIDFFRNAGAGTEWVPLDSVERFGYSTLRIYVWGSARLPEDASWWRRLKRAEQPTDEGPVDEALAESLSAINLDDLDSGLGACRSLLGWKYPGNVWKVNAFRLQDFPVHLGRHRFGIWDGSAAVWWRHAAIELADYSATAVTPVARQFLLGSQPACLRIPRACMEIGQGAAFSTPVGRSLNVAAEIHAAGSLRDFVVAAIQDQCALDQDVIPCYTNFLAVHAGHEKEFSGFNLRQFLKGGVAGVSGLEERTESLDESQPRFDVKTLLSPEHLLSCVRALNRRCRVVERASQDDADHPLSRMAQTIERLSQRMEIQAPGLAQLIGWKDPGTPWWEPPLLANRWARKIAQLSWMVAAISRLTANGKLTRDQFDARMEQLFCRNAPSPRKIQNRLCILLSQGPELFGFYLALFELMFPVPNP